MEQVKGFLMAKEPFDFGKSLQFIEGFTPTRGQQVLTKQKVSKAISIEKQAIVFKVEDSPGGVNYTLLATKLDERLMKQTEKIISDYLGLQDDLSELYRIGEQDPAFSPILQKLYGYHQVRFLTPFENAAWAVISQRTPMAVAAKTKAQVAESFGPKLNIPGEGEFIAFPEPDVIQTAGAENLLPVLKNERKVDYLLNVAQAFNTTLRLAETEKLSREELKQKLLAVKGIGEWSAEFILIRGFGRMGGLPRGEKRHEEIVSRLYNQGKPVTEADITCFAAPYGEVQGYWAHYLRVGGN